MYKAIGAITGTIHYTAKTRPELFRQIEVENLDEAVYIRRGDVKPLVFKKWNSKSRLEQSNDLKAVLKKHFENGTITENELENRLGLNIGYFKRKMKDDNQTQAFGWEIIFDLEKEMRKWKS